MAGKQAESHGVKMPFDGSSFIRHIAERLIHEFAFSHSAGTPGLIGAAKERSARIQLERLMPGGVRVGSGIIVDSYGQVSRQQDIVIYEDLCPVFSQTDTPDATYYPIEGVIAVGEVKSRLGKKELIDAIDNCASVKNLTRHAVYSDEGLGFAGVAFRNYNNTNCFIGLKEEQFEQNRKSLDQVFSFLLCNKFHRTAKNTLNSFVDKCVDVGTHLVPNIVVSLENGAFYAFSNESGSIRRAMNEADSMIYCRDPIEGFAQLVTMLRQHVVSGHTVDRTHYERYFRRAGEADPTFQINERVAF